jgi:hypothetical protein
MAANNTLTSKLVTVGSRDTHTSSNYSSYECILTYVHLIQLSELEGHQYANALPRGRFLYSPENIHR